jgi:hypothetical protein
MPSHGHTSVTAVPRQTIKPSDLVSSVSLYGSSGSVRKRVSCERVCCALCVCTVFRRTAVHTAKTTHPKSTAPDAFPRKALDREQPSACVTHTTDFFYVFPGHGHEYYCHYTHEREVVQINERMQVQNHVGQSRVAEIQPNSPRQFAECGCTQEKAHTSHIFRAIIQHQIDECVKTFQHSLDCVQTSLANE